MQHRAESIVIETVRHRITGTLTLPADGYRSRMSDYLNSSDRVFIPLTDVQIEPLDGGKAIKRGFIAVSRDHIVLAMPDDPNSAG